MTNGRSREINRKEGEGRPASARQIGAASTTALTSQLWPARFASAPWPGSFGWLLQENAKWDCGLNLTFEVSRFELQWELLSNGCSSGFCFLFNPIQLYCILFHFIRWLQLPLPRAPSIDLDSSSSDPRSLFETLDSSIRCNRDSIPFDLAAFDCVQSAFYLFCILTRARARDRGCRRAGQRRSQG